MPRSVSLPQRIAFLVLRSALLLAGVVFGLALLVAALVATGVLLLWSLLRGRRPVLPLYWRVFRAAAGRPFARATPQRPHSAARAGRAGLDAEVVDVEAREIPSTGLPPR